MLRQCPAGYAVNKLQIVLADRDYIGFRQKQAAEGLAQFLRLLKRNFSVGARLAGFGEQDIAFLVVDQISATGPNHQVVVGVQEFGTPTVTTTIDCIHEVERRMAAKKADVMDRLLHAHTVNIVARNDLDKSEL